MVYPQNEKIIQLYKKNTDICYIMAKSQITVSERNQT